MKGKEPAHQLEGSQGLPKSQPPGDAEPQTADVTIPNGFASVAVDKRPVDIGKLTMGGSGLTIWTGLTVQGGIDATDFDAAVVESGSLSLLGGGNIRGLDVSVQSNAGVHLSGAMTLAGEALFIGQGTVNFGSEAKALDLTLAQGTALRLSLVEKGAHVRGELRAASADVLNEGKVIWHSGRIGVGSFGSTARKFSNRGDFEIPAGSASRRLDGLFVNEFRNVITPTSRTVQQRGTFTLGGLIENHGRWVIAEVADILDSGTGRIENSNDFVIGLSQPGTVHIDPVFGTTQIEAGEGSVSGPV